MDNKFIWVPFFKELAKKLLDYGDNHRMLIQVLKKCGISDGMDDVDVGDKKIELDDIDPFTFFSFIMKYGEEKRIHYLEKIKQELSIQSELPKDFSGVPSTFAVKVWLFSFKKNRGEADIANLWKLFNQALSSALDTDLFKQVLKIHGVGKPKLTQSLFIASPDNYFPIDKQSIPYLKNRGINQSFDTLQEYLQIIDNIKNIIKKPLYEISHDAWFETTGPGKSPNGQGIKYWLYAPGREARYWDEYYKKGIIGIGPNEIGDFRQFSSKKEIYKRLQEINKSDLSPTNDSLASWEFLDVMKPGDIIIVKKGRRHYLGYGIVAGDYEYDISRTDYHQIRKVAWKKEGVWEEKGTPIVVKSLTDITKYPDYVKKLKKLIGIPEHQKTSEKNIILYGPPGTGKTYQTINYACAIIENNTIQEINQEESGVENGRKIILDRFHEYVKREQIQFITFHQSFSYEDFIEGIKPVLNKQDLDSSTENFSYTIEPGVFLRICEQAKSYMNYLDQKQEKLTIRENILETAEFFKMSLGDTQISEDIEIYNYCIKNKCISLGYGGNIDYSDAKNREEISNLFKNKYPDESEFNIFAIERFKLWMKRNDIVLISFGNRLLRAVGIIEGNYYYDNNTGIPYNHYRKVRWVGSDLNIPVTEVYQKNFSQQTIYQLDNNIVKREFFKVSTERDSQKKNHVLIIDEINRGNISKIFGELITLIEDNKRKGNKEELEVTLPYSKNKFSVPPNLYILGTMNTADRSIALLDSALRRRFNFVEIMPDPQLLPEDFEGINIRELLSVMNERIEFLLDRDHTLGHSYFLNLKSYDDLCMVFKNNIIPLLQEYFYNDWQKIQLVLGDNTDWKKEDKHRFILKKQTYDSSTEKKLFGLDLEDFEDITTYKLNENLIKENYTKIPVESFTYIYNKPIE